ncbi:MAG: hypothetical protein WC533_03945 [Candidatus Pacearchaeota archaeon]
MNNKAVSEIIVTMLFILLVIASISIIWFSVSKITSTNLSPQLSCTEMKINPPVSINKICDNIETRDIEAVVERSNNEAVLLSSLEFVISSDTQREGYTCCADDCPNCEIVRPGQYKKYYFYTENLGENPVFILSVDGCTLESVQIKEC